VHVAVVVVADARERVALLHDVIVGRRLAPAVGGRGGARVDDVLAEPITLPGRTVCLIRRGRACAFEQARLRRRVGIVLAPGRRRESADADTSSSTTTATIITTFGWTRVGAVEQR